jgi:hypothetical protein
MSQQNGSDNECLVGCVGTGCGCMIMLGFCAPVAAVVIPFLTPAAPIIVPFIILLVIFAIAGHKK